MTTSIGNARSYKDLLESEQDGQYIFSRIFSDEGWRARKRSKKKFRLLKRIEPVLTPMLREGERVFFLTKGVTSLSLIEWWLLGMVLYYLNRRAIVLTTQRVLLVQINSRENPRDLKSQIDWAAIARLETSLFGATNVEFRGRKRLQISGVPRTDRKWLKTVMNEVLTKLESRSCVLEVEELCPHCAEPISLGPDACRHCSGRLKSPRKACLLSLVFPGAGDLYLGHGFFAALELLISFLFWFGIIASAFDPTVRVVDLLIGAAFVIVIYHGLDAFATYRIALKGAYPATEANDNWRFFSAAALPTIALVAILVSAGSKYDLRPTGSLVDGSEIPGDHIAALLTENLIGPSEQIHFFYSHGESTILEDGNLFTDDRILSYGWSIDGIVSFTTMFRDVADLHLFPSETPGDAGIIQVIPANNEAYYLFAPPDIEEAGAFMGALLERWRIVRQVSSAGVWYDGGMGESFEDAILIRGLSSPDSYEAAQRWWLTLWFGQEGTEWKIANREQYEMSGRAFEQLVVQGSDGEQRQFLFDVGQAGAAR